MKKITIALLTALMLAGASCSSDRPTPEPKGEDPLPTPDPGTIQTFLAPHYVLTYATEPEFATTVDLDEPVLFLGVTNTKSISWFHHKLRPQDSSPYLALCNKNDDYAYQEERREGPGGYEGGYDYLADNLVAIDVVSDKDYDAAHPAGSSLNDLCILASASPRKHIASRYTETFDWKTSTPEIFASLAFCYASPEGSIPFQKLLSECTADDMVLMGSGFIEAICELHFTKRPDAGLKQRFTVTLKDEAGKTFTTTTREVEW